MRRGSRRLSVSICGASLPRTRSAGPAARAYCAVRPGDGEDRDGGVDSVFGASDARAATVTSGWGVSGPRLDRSRRDREPHLPDRRAPGEEGRQASFFDLSESSPQSPSYLNCAEGALVGAIFGGVAPFLGARDPVEPGRSERRRGDRTAGQHRERTTSRRDRCSDDRGRLDRDDGRRNRGFAPARVLRRAT